MRKVIYVIVGISIILISYLMIKFYNSYIFSTEIRKSYNDECQRIFGNVSTTAENTESSYIYTARYDISESKWDNIVNNIKDYSASIDVFLDGNDIYTHISDTVSLYALFSDDEVRGLRDKYHKGDTVRILGQDKSRVCNIYTMDTEKGKSVFVWYCVYP